MCQKYPTFILKVGPSRNPTNGLDSGWEQLTSSCELVMKLRVPQKTANLLTP
jgi:hypothetical protein